MKLYDTPLAPNPRRVRWVMAEKGIDDIEVRTLNLIKGEQRDPDYVAKAGLARVPMLELDDGTCIAESVAICRYLESVYPEPNMFGRDAREQAVIEMWTRRGELLVSLPFMNHVRHTAPPLAALETQDPAVAARALKDGLGGLKVLDRQLADSEWVAAGRITIADVVAFSGLDFTRLIRWELPDGYPNVARWIEAMRVRPAAAAGMPVRNP